MVFYMFQVTRFNSAIIWPRFSVKYFVIFNSHINNFLKLSKKNLLFLMTGSFLKKEGGGV